MFLEAVKPSSDLDAALARVLSSRDIDGFEAARLGLEAGLAALAEAAVRGELDAGGLHRLGRGLDQAGHVAAAALSFDLALSPDPGETGPDARFRAAIHDDAGALRRRLGLAFGAAARARAAARLRGDGAADETLPELDEGGLMVLSAYNDPHGHAERWAGVNCPQLSEDPLRDPGLAKRLFLAGTQTAITGFVDDFSFFVQDEASGEAVLLVECDAIGDRHLGCREAGIVLAALSENQDLVERASGLALRQLRLTAAWAGCPHALLDIPASAPPKALAAFLGDPRGWGVVPYRLGWIDLGQEPGAIEKGYRSGTRQSVAWGRKHMTIRGHGEDGIDAIAAYAALMAASGRALDIDPDQLRACVAAGEIVGHVGVLAEEAVAVILTSVHGGVAYEMAAAKRIMGKEPLTHLVIHEAVLAAKARGQRRYDFGPLYDSAAFGPKLKSVSNFKSGFASSFESRLLVELKP